MIVGEGTFPSHRPQRFVDHLSFARRPSSPELICSGIWFTKLVLGWDPVNPMHTNDFRS